LLASATQLEMQCPALQRWIKVTFDSLCAIRVF
jgi:hypothetical protein